MRSRVDQPDITRQNFVKTMGELIKDHLFHFELVDLSASELSKVYDFAQIESKEWKGALVTVRGTFLSK